MNIKGGETGRGSDGYEGEGGVVKINNSQQARLRVTLHSINDNTIPFLFFF